MSAEAVPPVFVFALDSDDIEVAPSLDGASRCIEPYDVDISEVVDASGRRYRAEAHGLDTVLVDTAEADRAALEARLHRYVAERGINFSASGDYVVAVANALTLQEWESRRPRWPRWLDRRLHGPGPTRFD